MEVNGTTSARRYRLNADARLNDVNVFTVLFLVQPQTVQGSGDRYFQKSQTTNARQLLTTADGGLQFSINRATTTASAVTVAGAQLRTGKWSWLACTYDNSDGPRIFVAELGTRFTEASYASRTAGAGTVSADDGLWIIGNTEAATSASDAYYSFWALFKARLLRQELNALVERFDPRYPDLLAAIGFGVYNHFNEPDYGPLQLRGDYPTVGGGIGIMRGAPGVLLRGRRRTLAVAPAAGSVALVVQDATVGIAAESPALVQQNLLAVAEALVSISADAPALVQKSLLAPADATVGILAESPTLSTALLLAVADAAVAIAADAPALLQKNLLAVGDALVAIAGESPALVQKNLMTVPDAVVGITADNVTLSLAALLVVAEAAVAVTAEGVVLATDVPLAIQDALVGIGAESPALIQASVLTIPDTLVAILAGGLVLVIPSEAAVGKYAPEHAAALEAIRGAQGFASEHAGALADLRQAGA
jgi:hypothetical protein